MTAPKAYNINKLFVSLSKLYHSYWEQIKDEHFEGASMTKVKIKELLRRHSGGA